MKRTVLLLMVFVISVVSGVASSDTAVHIQHFGEREGFSATLVEHIIQDRQGYIWMATWDGLRRYDGYRFETFKAVPGDKSPLETNRFTYIEDPDGTLIEFVETYRISVAKKLNWYISLLKRNREKPLSKLLFRAMKMNRKKF